MIIKGPVMAYLG